MKNNQTRNRQNGNSKEDYVGIGNVWYTRKKKDLAGQQGDNKI